MASVDAADDTLCPACGGAGCAPLFVVRHHRYVQCTTCASGRLDPLPTTDPIELYDRSYFEGAHNGGYLDYDADAALHRRNAQARLDRLTAAVSPGPHHLIDIGCASGYVLDEAIARGWTAVGVDASAHARAVAASRGHTPYADLHTALAPGPAPSIVTFFQVLEHLRDPEVVLQQAVDAMTPGGVVAIETWDRSSRIARAFGARWQQANPPSVIHLFSHDGIERLVARAGLRLISLRPTPKQVSVGLVAGVAAGRWPVMAKALGPVQRREHIAGLALPYRLGDLVTAIARVP